MRWCRFVAGGWAGVGNELGDMSVLLSFCPFVCLPVCLPVCLSVCLSACLSVCPSPRTSRLKFVFALLLRSDATRNPTLLRFPQRRPVFQLSLTHFEAAVLPVLAERRAHSQARDLVVFLSTCRETVDPHLPSIDSSGEGEGRGRGQKDGEDEAGADHLERLLSAVRDA